MALTDNMLALILPEAGETVIKNLVDDETFSGTGTLTLVDREGRKAWRFVDGLQTLGIPSFAHSGLVDNNGYTLAVRIHVTATGSTSAQEIFATRKDASARLALRRNSSNFQARYGASGGSLNFGVTFTGVTYTFVIRMNTLAASSSDSLSVWFNTVDRVGTDPNLLSSGENLNTSSTTTDTLVFNSAGGLTYEVLGAAMWSREISNAEAAAVADDFFGQLEAEDDGTAPTLTSPTGTTTGATTASGSVSTNEANGTLYYLASTNSTEIAATVKAASSQAVSATGVQSVSFTGLTASTEYYAHYVHRDAAGNDSAVESSTVFETYAAVTPPAGTVTVGTITPGETTASVPYSYDDTDETGYEYRIDGGTATSLGSSPATITGLTAATTYNSPGLQVRAINDGGAGAWSTAVTFETEEAGTPPAGTTTIGTITVTDTTASVPWSYSESDHDAVEFRLDAGSWVSAGLTNPIELTGLTAETEYTIEVRPVNGSGTGTADSEFFETAAATSAGTVTVTDPLKNNTGTVLASQSGVKVAVLAAATLESVYEASGLTTNGSGLLSAISNAAITTGQLYHVAIKLADGGVGITGPITAS